MNVFKRIFGKKEDELTSIPENKIIENQTENQAMEEVVKIMTNPILIKVTVEQSTEENELYKPKHYKIPSVVKAAKSKLKKEGIQSCINYINQILNDSEQLQQDQSISLTRNLVKILVTEKHQTLNNFEDLINHCLSKYNVQNDPMFYSSIATIYNEYNPQLAIQYLTSKNGELLNNKTFQSLNYFLFLDKVNILIEQNNLVSAEEEIQKANEQIENNSMFQFLSDKIKFTNLYSTIKFNEKDYRTYFKFYIMSFILDIAKDISSFPIGLNGFHHRKMLCNSGEWGLDYDDLEEIPNISKVSKDNFEHIKKEVYDLSFYHLPVLIGIDAKYIENESTTDDLKRDYPNEWFSKYNNITNAPFQYYDFIEKFTEEIITKYN